MVFLSTFIQYINIINLDMRKKVILFTFILFFIFPLSTYPLIRENWPTYMGNQYLTGNNDGIIPESDGIIWTFSSDGKLFNPVSVNGRVFIVSTDHYLYCLDAADGSLLWEFKAEGPLTRMVAVYEGYVYLPAGRFLYCIDEEKGKVIWGRRDPSFGFYGTPTIARGKIFYGNRKGFFSRELRNGHLIWENKNIYTYGGFPSYWNGLVFTVSKEFQKESAFLIALNENDGTLRWFAELQNVPNIFSPVVYNEKVYLSSGNTMSVFNAETGEKVLEKAFDAIVASNAVFSQGHIFLSLSDGRILKIDPETGDESVIYNAPFRTQFAVVGSYLFIPIKGERGALVTVDSESGDTVNRIDTLKGEPSALTISKGILFLPAEHTLLAIGDGRLVRATRPEKIEKPEVTTTEKVKEPEEPVTKRVEKAELPGETVSGMVEETAAAKVAKPQETATIKGEVKDRDSGRPLSGTVEATTELESGTIVKKEEAIQEGKFEIEIPKKGQTDLILSSPGYTFNTITLPDEKAIDDLSMQPLDLSLSKAKKGETLKFESVQYKTGNANLEPSSLGTLDKMLTMMKENPEIKIEIAGHTDSTGNKEFNMKLSKMRAESVAHWLIRNGISSKRIITKGYGDTKPAADNTSVEGRRKNRRTEILIIDD